MLDLVPPPAELKITNRPARTRKHSTGWERITITEPIRCPLPNTEYGIKLNGGKGYATRQTGLATKQSVFTNAGLLLGPYLKRPVREDDFVVFQQGGRYGFVPAGGTPPVDAPPAPASPVIPEMSSACRAGIRTLLFVLIDGETGRYQEGSSDETVAVEVGCSLDQVRTIRLAVYGEPQPLPISPDPTRFDVLARRVEKMAEELTALARDISAEMSPRS